MRRLLVLGLVILMALLQMPLVEAQDARTALFSYKYDLDSAALIYCRVLGQNRDPWGGPVQGPAPVDISSANGNVTATTASTNPFFGLGINDVIIVRFPNGTSEAKVIVTFTDNDTIVVDSAFSTTVTGTVFSYLDSQCGTASTDGWIDVSGIGDKAMTFQLEQVNATAVHVVWECKDDGVGSEATIVYPGESDGCGQGTLGTNVCVFSTAGRLSRTKVVSFEPWSACRMGLKIDTDDGGDTGVNAEQVTMTVTKRLSR